MEKPKGHQAPKGFVSSSNAEKAVRTTMIGAIDRVEQYFGDLWGFGTPTSPKQANDIKERFLKFRESMLDYGESQVCKLKGVKWEKKQ